MGDDCDIDKAIEGLRRDLERLIDERHERYEQRFLGQERAVAAALTAAKEAVASALAAAKEAVVKAETASDARFASVNEFRAQLADQSSTFLPRSEAGLALDAIRMRIDELTTKLNTIVAQAAGLVGKSAGAGVLYSNISTGLSLVISIVAVIVAAIVASR